MSQGDTKSKTADSPDRARDRPLAGIRDRIRAETPEQRWLIDQAPLADKQLVRRIILKGVIHGVDKSPMAVELAKLSLWLHTFTVGAPLSFLDHHLRCGDSLFGEWVRPALDRFARVGLFKSQAVKKAELAIGSMQQIEEATDADIAEVRQSAATFEAVKADTAELTKLLSVLQGFRWIGESPETALKQARALRREADRLALSDP